MAWKLLLAVMVLASAVACSSTFTSLGGFGGGQVRFIIPNGGATATEEGDDEVGERTCHGFGIMGDCNPITNFFNSLTVHRNLMWTRERYISYSAMRKNSIPCSRRGSSYYNCRPGKAVNPYHRGCSAITMCARSW